MRIHNILHVRGDRLRAAKSFPGSRESKGIVQKGNYVDSPLIVVQTFAHNRIDYLIILIRYLGFGCALGWKSGVI
jgi:hypothetical protein